MNSLFNWFIEENPVNPYESPQPSEGSADFDSSRLSREDKYRLIGQVFWRWEKLRILYNAVLVIEVLLMTSMLALTRADSAQKIFHLRFCEQVIVGGLAANLLFLLGHYINAYLAWFGFRQRFYTAIIFLAGLAIAFGLTALVIGLELLPVAPDW